MPYVEGETLRERLERERQLPLADALAIAREVADALAYAHSRGLVHRDVKPENIMLSGSHARLADFGIARALVGEGTALTEAGMAVGTAAYMSPEQASGGRVDARTDVYALGCVLYEMLAGQPPYSGPTAQALIGQTIGAPIPSVRHLRPDVPKPVDRIIQKALAKAAAGRFASTRDFPRLGARRIGALARRYPLGTIGAAVVLLAAITVGVVAGRHHTTAGDVPPGGYSLLGRWQCCHSRA